MLADQLNTGSHLLSVSEDMQMTWFGVEHELNQMISGGLIPTYDINSAGQYEPRTHPSTAVDVFVNPFSAVVIIVPYNSSLRYDTIKIFSMYLKGDQLP